MNPPPIPFRSMSREDIFLARYSWLKSWAVQLSEGDRFEAEDLVHDAFIQFVLCSRDLSEINDLNGYLYGMLRSLRFSYLRKRTRKRENPLEKPDMLPVTVVLDRSPSVQGMLEARGDLQRVCEYACMRKDASKMGSVLILRFIHGYFPKEIAAILRSSLRLANDWLRLARNELENREFVPIAPAWQYPASLDDIVQALRARVWQAKSGSCLDAESLYQERHVPTASELSHVVSCRECLEQATEYLGLRAYSERDVWGMLGVDLGRYEKTA